MTPLTLPQLAEIKNKSTPCNYSNKDETSYRICKAASDQQGPAKKKYLAESLSLTNLLFFKTK